MYLCYIIRCSDEIAHYQYFIFVTILNWGWGED